MEHPHKQAPSALFSLCCPIGARVQREWISLSQYTWCCVSPSVRTRAITLPTHSQLQLKVALSKKARLRRRRTCSTFSLPLKCCGILVASAWEEPARSVSDLQFWLDCVNRQSHSTTDFFICSLHSSNDARTDLVASISDVFRLVVPEKSDPVIFGFDHL